MLKRYGRNMTNVVTMNYNCSFGKLKTYIRPIKGVPVEFVLANVTK